MNPLTRRSENKPNSQYFERLCGTSVCRDGIGPTQGQIREVKHSSKLVQLCKHEELHESPHKLVLPQRKHSERRILLLDQM